MLDVHPISNPTSSNFNVHVTFSDSKPFYHLGQYVHMYKLQYTPHNTNIIPLLHRQVRQEASEKLVHDRPSVRTHAVLQAQQLTPPKH